MSVPEASVDKNNASQRGENNVGSTWQVCPVNPEPISHSEGETTYRQLGSSVLTPDRGHDPTSSFVGPRVHPSMRARPERL
jgi:hypothetical protein